MGVGARRRDPRPGEPGLPQRRCRIIEVQMLIPVLDNEGNAFTNEHDVVFETQLATLFKGFTREPAKAAGGWVDEGGRYYPDAMRIYVVAVGGLITDGAALRFATIFAKQHYRQEKIYLRYLGLSEIL